MTLLNVPVSVMLVILVVIAVVSGLMYLFMSSSSQSPVPPVSFAIGGLTYALSDNAFVIPFRASLSPESPPIAICKVTIDYIDENGQIKKVVAWFSGDTSSADLFSYEEFVGNAPIARVSSSNPVLKLLAYSGGVLVGATYVYLNSMTFVYYNGQGQVVVSGSVPIYQSGINDYINPILRNYGVLFVPNPTPNQLTTLAVREYSAGIIYIQLYPIYGATRDGVIIWEDLVGPLGTGSPYVDGNGDEWVRITQLADGSWRVAIIKASGGFKHEVYIENNQMYVKNYGFFQAGGYGNTWREIVSPAGRINIKPSSIIRESAVDMVLEVSVLNAVRAEPQSIVFYLCVYGETTPKWSVTLLIPGTNIKP